MPKVGKCELIYLQPRPRYYELSPYPAVTGCNTPILQNSTTPGASFFEDATRTKREVDNSAVPFRLDCNAVTLLDGNTTRAEFTEKICFFAKLLADADRKSYGTEFRPSFLRGLKDQSLVSHHF